MATLYKVRGQKLPTIIFKGDKFYEFVRDGHIFKLETDNQKLIDEFLAMGYQLMPESGVVDGAPNAPRNEEVPVSMPKTPAPRVAAKGK